ncbi:hypothetical protein BH20CHL6_BH20CHL6_15160 [soil metagenome]
MWSGGQGKRRWAPVSLAAIFAASGALHLVVPGIFAPLVPRLLPAPRELVYLSGIAELVCAAGLIARAPCAGPASALLLLALLPANVQFALDAAADGTVSRSLVTLAWVRVPLQVPLIWAALQPQA